MCGYERRVIRVCGRLLLGGRGRGYAHDRGDVRAQAGWTKRCSFLESGR